MNVYDDLLLWASEKRQGSLMSLNEACRWVAAQSGVATWTTVRDDIIALGHVSLQNGRWQVNAPCHVLLADSGGNGMMVGARPVWLCDLLQDLDSAEEPTLRDLADHTVENLAMPQVGGPATWWLSFGPEAPTRALTTVGVRTAEDLAGAALTDVETRGFPHVRRTVRPGEPTARLASEGLAADGVLDWSPTAHDRDLGVYRYLRTNQRVFAVRGAEGWLECDERWATWMGLTHPKHLLWSQIGERTLHVSTAARLPVELERALVLRSGRLPSLGVSPDGKRRVRTYVNVTHSFATRVARLIKKELTQA